VTALVVDDGGGSIYIYRYYTNYPFSHPPKTPLFSSAAQSSSSPMSTIGIPIKLLHEAVGHIVTAELTNGSVYRGKLAEGIAILE
jgi:hypothetical protein